MSVEADEIWAILREVAAEQKALQESQKETDRKLEKVSDLLGSIGKNQGDVAEEFFFNSLADDPHLGGIHFDDISKKKIQTAWQTARRIRHCYDQR